MSTTKETIGGRHIVSISVAHAPESNRVRDHILIIALCDDSSVWELCRPYENPAEGKWARLPDIPQEVEPATKREGK